MEKTCVRSNRVAAELGALREIMEAAVSRETKTQTESPTDETREVEREGKMILQRLWATKNYVNGELMSGGTDWRDDKGEK